MQGDLCTSAFEDLCREAPSEATLVVFHTAVLGYVADPASRLAFAERARSLCRYWIANESPRVLPDIARRAAQPGQRGQFLLSVNGSAVAWTDPHGQSMHWIADRAIA